jgi:hypothetical protein
MDERRKRGIFPGMRSATTGAAPLLALLLSACGGEDTLAPFDVTLTAFSDCEQVGQGGVNCADEGALRAVSVEGRWVIDYRTGNTFVLVTENGRSLPGVYFANDGRVATRACTGAEGGTCHFSRVRTTGEDPQSGCPRTEERVIDVVVADGQVQGQLSDVGFTAEGCGTPIIRELLVQVTGAAASEAVRARQEFGP